MYFKYATKSINVSTFILIMHFRLFFSSILCSFCRQLEYDDDTLYDVSVQMNADANGDLEVIVPGHRKHRYIIKISIFDYM